MALTIAALLGVWAAASAMSYSPHHDSVFSGFRRRRQQAFGFNNWTDFNENSIDTDPPTTPVPTTKTNVSLELGRGWIKKSEYCPDTFITAYDSMERAKAECLRLDCSGVYDSYCDGRGQFYLCKNARFPRSFSGSCVYVKPQPPMSTTPTPITCDGSQIPYWTDHTYWRQDSSPGRVGVGSSLVFQCNEGYRQGTVVYTCGADGKFWTTDRCVKITTTTAPRGYSACKMNDLLGIAGSHFQCYPEILGMGTPCTCLCTFAEADVRTFTSCSLGGDKKFNLHQQWQACRKTDKSCGKEDVVVVHGRRLRSV